MPLRKKQQTSEEQARAYVYQYVRFGFYEPAEIARIVGEDVFEGAIPPIRLREMIAIEIEQKQAEENSWPPITYCDRLDDAFAKLNAAGILALHNAGLTPSECIGEVTEIYHEAGGEKSGIIGYCFYHRQDMERALRSGELGLSYGDIRGDSVKGTDIGHRIRHELEQAGLKVSWTGSIEDSQIIKEFNWQRRHGTKTRAVPQRRYG